MVNRLKKNLGNKISFISFDNYYRPRESQLQDDNGIKNFDLPESMDIDSFLKDLDLLKKGATIVKKAYTFNNSEAEASEIIIEPHELIVVEGLFIYHYKELRSQFDIKIFVEAKDELKIIRRIKRDKEERNYPLEDVLYRYENHVLPSYRKFIAPYIDEMDVIISNNKSFDVGVAMLEAYFLSLIKNNQA